MKKDNIMFAATGLLVGLIVGFMFANSVNRSALEKQPVAAGANLASAERPNLPPDHPPIGSTTNALQDGPLPQVTAAIDKARQEPKNYEAQMTAGDLYYQIQKYEDAAKFYEIANRLKPADSEPMIKAGNAYFDADKYEQAEKWYLAALEKDPKNISVRTDLGLTFYLRTPRDVDRAINEYKTSLSIDPNHEVTLQNLALAYEAKNDQENLRTTIEKLKKINPGNPVVLKTGGN